nr:uncharacterized protein LOC109157428 [Ipomoea batatas]
MSLAIDQNQSEECHRQLRAAHDVLQSDHHPLRDDNSCLKQEHQALQEQYRQRDVTHAAALQTIIQEWRGSEDFIRVADEHAMSRGSGLSLVHQPTLDPDFSRMGYYTKWQSGNGSYHGDMATGDGGGLKRESKGWLLVRGGVVTGRRCRLGPPAGATTSAGHSAPRQPNA